VLRTVPWFSVPVLPYLFSVFLSMCFCRDFSFFFRPSPPPPSQGLLDKPRAFFTFFFFSNGRCLLVPPYLFFFCGPPQSSSLSLSADRKSDGFMVGEWWLFFSLLVCPRRHVRSCFLFPHPEFRMQCRRPLPSYSPLCFELAALAISSFPLSAANSRFLACSSLRPLFRFSPPPGVYLGESVFRLPAFFDPLWGDFGSPLSFACAVVVYADGASKNPPVRTLPHGWSTEPPQPFFPTHPSTKALRADPGTLLLVESFRKLNSGT